MMDIGMIALFAGGFAVLVLLTRWCHKQNETRE